ncbi:hypothetical protein [Methylobacterium hispanicum]|nr:hypothetical protein [Methylobacterium hispanicum]
MASPIAASRAWVALNPLVGDDTLFDMLDLASDRNPEADVRPLVAITLDEWANWMCDGRFRHPWGDGCRERLQALAKAHAGTAIEDLVSRVMVPDTLEGARGAYALLFGSPEAAPEFEVVRTEFPGVYAVRETASGSLARLEVIFGVIAEAEPSMVDALRAIHFPCPGVVPAP